MSRFGAKYDQIVNRDFLIGEAGQYRAVNVHPEQRNTGEKFWNYKDIGSLLENSSRYAGLKWQIVSNGAQCAYNRIVREIPILMVIDMFYSLAQPIWTDFTETNRDHDFARISHSLYRELFTQEHIYVSYNIFENPDNYELIPDKITNEIKESIEDIRDRGGFDIWVRTDGQFHKRSGEFMHLETGLQIKLDRWRDYLVEVYWSNQNVGNFRKWFAYALNWVVTNLFLENYRNVTGKKVLIKSIDNTPNKKEDLEAMMTSIQPIINSTYMNDMGISRVEYSTGQDFVAMVEGSYKMLDRMAFELGRVSNTNPKGERLTSGENYKDISSIANRQKDVLENLKLFAMDVKEKWGIELEFAISGIPEKQMLDTEVHKAPNPNSSSSDSQREGEGILIK